MAAHADPLDLQADDRTFLEVAFARLAIHGKIPPSGQRDVTFRLDENGRIRWFEASTVRVPASELERSE